MPIVWLLVLCVILTSCEKETPVEAIRPVKAIQVQGCATSEGQIIFPGSLRAFTRADLSFRVDGTVITRDITVGQEVKKGQLLIKLDPRDYEIALRKAEGKVESTKAQLDFASRDYVRMQNIHTADPGAISESFLDRKLETQNQLTAELEIAKGDLDKAKDDLSYTTLKAPFDGVVAAIYVENHEQIRQKQVVVRILDTVEREMEINVPEKYINAMIAGGSRLVFTVRLDAFPGKDFPAVIKEIGTEAASTTQTYPVTLTLQKIPTELSLLAGMSGKAILEKPVKKGKTAVCTFKVPKAAVFTDNLSHEFVWIVDPKTQTVQKRGVVLAEGNKSDSAIIKEGVANGDWVVTAGTSFLREGQKVKFGTEQPTP